MLLLVVFLLLVALPVAMGHMDHVGDCPACTSSKVFSLGLCAVILGVVGLAVLLSATRFRPSPDARYRFDLATSIYRPPRAA